MNDLRDAKFRLGLVSLDSDQRHRELSAGPATLTAITSIVCMLKGNQSIVTVFGLNDFKCEDHNIRKRQPDAVIQ